VIRVVRSNPVRSGRAFSLVEILISILIISLLLALAVVSYRAATLNAKSAADRAAVNSLRIAVENFRREFGFLPPLVDDFDPVQQITGSPDDPADGFAAPNLRQISANTDVEVLRGEYPGGNTSEPSSQYSLYSLPYYIIGALDRDVDGVDGPGFVKPLRRGAFDLVGLSLSSGYQSQTDLETGNASVGGNLDTYGSFFDAQRGGFEVFRDKESAPDLVEIRDRKGVAVRYYRWLPDVEDPAEFGLSEDDTSDLQTADSDQINDDPTSPDYLTEGVDGGLRAYLNTPWMVGDPETNTEVRSASYAIVAAGPNGVFGDESIEEIARALSLDSARLNQSGNEAARNAARMEAAMDNIVEVGR